MLRWIGILLVVAGCSGLGFYMKQSVGRHIQMLYEMKRVLICIRNNMEYTRRPMGEILLDAADSTKGILRECLLEMEREILALSGTGLYEIWEEVLLSHEKELLVNREELRILCNAGRNLGVLDLSQQLELVVLSQQQLEELILRAFKEQKEKEKVYQSLGIMAGLFIIVILL